MKIPKKMTRYCPRCKKHTEQSVIKQTTGRVRGKMKAGQRRYTRLSGIIGYGGFPRPKLEHGKKYGAKLTKKVSFKFTCKECKKSSLGKGKRAKKLEMV